MSERDAPTRLPDLVLERYRLGELPSTEAEAVERRLSEDASERARLEALAASDAQIRRHYPPEWLAGQVRNRLPRRPEATRRPAAPWVRWAIPAAMAAMSVVLVLSPTSIEHAPEPVTPSAGPGVRIKGSKPALVLFRKTEAGSAPVADGDPVRAGDLIRVGYRAAGRAYGVIVSIDGRGTMTLHLPARPGTAAELRSGDTVLLDHSYELDDAPDFERFYFVTSETPFDAADVVRAAEAAAAGSGAPRAGLDLPGSLEQTVVSVVKGGGP